MGYAPNLPSLRLCWLHREAQLCNHRFFHLPSHQQNAYLSTLQNTAIFSRLACFSNFITENNRITKPFSPHRLLVCLLVGKPPCFSKSRWFPCTIYIIPYGILLLEPFPTKKQPLFSVGIAYVAVGNHLICHEY